MTAGIVLETLDTAERVWINVRVSGPSYCECAIFVERTHASRSVSPGDRIRWEGGRAYWTPKGVPFRDFLLVRVGPAGAERPQVSASVFVSEDGG